MVLAVGPQHLPNSRRGTAGVTYSKTRHMRNHSNGRHHYRNHIHRVTIIIISGQEFKFKRHFIHLMLLYVNDEPPVKRVGTCVEEARSTLTL